MFKQANLKNIYKDVIDQIEESIRRGDYSVGDRLPTEAELQKLFNVSRTPIREALKALSLKGLIEIRKGAKGGAYIKLYEIGHIVESLDRLINQQKVSMGHLAEFRVVVESAAGALAAERATPEEVSELRALVNRLMECSGKPELVDEFHKVERKCHLQLAQISHNPMYQWVLTTIHANIETYYGSLAGRDGYIFQLLDDWLQIVEGIENKQTAMVEAVLIAHVVISNRYLERMAYKAGLLTPDGRLKARS